MNKLLDYYKSEIVKYGGLNKYISAKAKEKRILLNKIKKYSKSSRKVIEAGCGSAVNSLYLVNNGRCVTCLDKDSEIIKFAKGNAKKFRRKPKFVRGNILDLKKSKNKFDVSFSHGVLEHYNDNKIVDLINAQLDVAKSVVFSVPSNFFKPCEAINGDERFLDKTKWIEIISKSKGKLVESFGYFYDSKEFRILFLKFISLITLGIFPLKKPYLGFVVRRA